MPPPSWQPAVWLLAATTTNECANPLRADDGDRTRDPQLGKLMLYQLSYVREATQFSPDSPRADSAEKRCRSRNTESPRGSLENIFVTSFRRSLTATSFGRPAHRALTGGQAPANRSPVDSAERASFGAARRSAPWIGCARSSLERCSPASSS